jgi:hypothetical protein
MNLEIAGKLEEISGLLKSSGGTDKTIYIESSSIDGGLGTRDCPYLVNTPEYFHRIMFNIAPGTYIRLAPGTYYAHPSGSGVGAEYREDWLTFKPGWRIVGSGMGQTIIHILPDKLLPNHKYAWIGAPPDYLSADDVEVCDLTIDCGFSKDSPEDTCISGICNAGSRTAYRRVEVIHWGSKKGESFPLVIYCGRDSKSSDYVVEGCRIHKLGYIKPISACASMIGIFGQDAAPEHFPNSTFKYGTVLINGIGARITDNYLDGHNPEGSIDAVAGISFPTCMASVISNNQIYGCFAGGPWQDSEPRLDCTFSGNLLHDCRFPIHQNLGYRPITAPDYKCRNLIVSNNQIYLARYAFWPTDDFPIGVRLLGDVPAYSTLPLPTSEFYSYDYVRIENNFIDFVDSNLRPYSLHSEGTAIGQELPHDFWSREIPAQSQAMIFSRIKYLELIHNTISHRFRCKYPIKARGCGTVYNHGNRVTNGKASTVALFRSNDGVKALCGAYPDEITEYAGLKGQN